MLKDLVKTSRVLHEQVFLRPAPGWERLQIVMHYYPKGRVRFFRALFPESGSRITAIHEVVWFEDMDPFLYKKPEVYLAFYAEFLEATKEEISEGMWPEVKSYLPRCNVTGRAEAEFIANACSKCSAPCCTVDRATTG